jgi:hypothetical protein
MKFKKQNVKNCIVIILTRINALLPLLLCASVPMCLLTFYLANNTGYMVKIKL